MAKFVELLKATMRRERQWADTVMDRGALRYEELVYNIEPLNTRRDFAATVPMPMLPHRDH